MGTAVEAAGTEATQLAEMQRIRWCYIQILIMAVLFNDHIYMMVSETEVNHGYADLSFIVRPDMRRFKPLDLVLEFKYVSLNEVKLSGEELRQKSREELMQLPLVASKLTEAEVQAMHYGDSLIERFKLPSITRFAVVALGWSDWYFDG